MSIRDISKHANIRFKRLNAIFNGKFYGNMNSSCGLINRLSDYFNIFYTNLVVLLFSFTNIMFCVFFFFHFFVWLFDVCSRQIKKKKKILYLNLDKKKETPNVPRGIHHNCNEVIVILLLSFVFYIIITYMCTLQDID